MSRNKYLRPTRLTTSAMIASLAAPFGQALATLAETSQQLAGMAREGISTPAMVRSMKNWFAA